MKKIFYIFIFLAHAFFSHADEDYQKQIDDLFYQLKTATSYEDSKEIESKIKVISAESSESEKSDTDNQ